MENEAKKIQPKMIVAAVLTIIGAAIQIAMGLYISSDSMRSRDYEMVHGEQFFNPGNLFSIFIEMIPVVLLFCAAVSSVTKKNNYEFISIPCFGFGIICVWKSVVLFNLAGIALGVLLFVCGFTISSKKPIKPLMYVTFAVGILKLILGFSLIGNASHMLALSGYMSSYCTIISIPVDFISSFFFAVAWLLVVSGLEKPEDEAKDVMERIQREKENGNEIKNDTDTTM